MTEETERGNNRYKETADDLKAFSPVGRQIIAKRAFSFSTAAQSCCIVIDCRARTRKRTLGRSSGCTATEESHTANATRRMEQNTADFAGGNFAG